AEKWRGKDEYAHELAGFTRTCLGEGRRYRRPLSTHVYKSPEAGFDSHAYQKGALVLHTLRRHLGDEAFFQGIRHYLTKYRHSPVDSHDFCNAMTEGTGANLEPFFDQWVFKPGHPVLDYSWTWDEEKKEVVLTVKQLQDTSDGTPVHDLHATVGLIRAGTLARKKVHVANAENQIRVDASIKPDAVLLDPDH